MTVEKRRWGGGPEQGFVKKTGNKRLQVQRTLGHPKSRLDQQAKAQVSCSKAVYLGIVSTGTPADLPGDSQLCVRQFLGGVDLQSITKI